MNQRLSDEDLVAVPGGFPREQERRDRALAALRDALIHEARVREKAASESAARARTAVWLGASLADLARVTGRTRQAARKRWPGLGDVQRRRQWLAGHADDILWSARLVLDRADEFPAPAVTRLRESVDAVATALTDDEDDPAPTAAHWYLLEELVDRHLRAAAGADLPPASTERAQFARHGAAGVVAYYDHATGRSDLGVDEADE